LEARGVELLEDDFSLRLFSRAELDVLRFDFVREGRTSNGEG